MSRVIGPIHRTQRQCHVNDYRQLVTIERQLSEIIRVCAGLSADFLRRYQISGDEHCLHAYHHYRTILYSFKNAHDQVKQGSRIQRRLWINLQRTPSGLIKLIRMLRSLCALLFQTYVKRA